MDASFIIVNHSTKTDNLSLVYFEDEEIRSATRSSMGEDLADFLIVSQYNA